MILKFDQCKECEKRTNDIYNCIHICDKPFEALEKFNKYKKLEKQGRLLKLPCAVGDKVFIIVGKDISKQTVKKIIIREDSVIIEANKRIFNKICFGKTVFLTKEEAEAALKGLERGKGNETD